MTLQIPRHYVATSISVIHSPFFNIHFLSLSLSLSTTHSDRENGVEAAHTAGDTWQIPKRSSSFEIFYFSFYNFKFVLKWYCHELLFCFSLSSNIYKINKQSFLIRKSLPSSVSVQIVEILMNNFNRKSK